MLSISQQSVASLNSLFDHMTVNTNLVFWIRSLNYQTQIYVSPNFEHVWGVPCAYLYSNPASWIDTLISEDRQQLEAIFQQRAQSLAMPQADINDDTLLFRVHSQQSTNTVYIRDKAFALIDHKQQPVAIAGIGMKLEPQHWEKAYQRDKEILSYMGEAATFSACFVFQAEKLAYFFKYCAK